MKNDKNVIDARPTKDFFITMLVKDIGLTRAILDLVDNALDGAKRLKGEGSYPGLWVRLKITKDRFEISDNCGGISAKLARDYAFRFGRPDEMRPTVHSIGQFGVGMKRALFKIGESFEISSTTKESQFLLLVDVPSWKKLEEWEFRFAKLSENGNFPKENRGTKIVVTAIHKEIAKEFEQENFQTQLINELEDAHIESLTKGLAISVNSIPLRVQPLKVLYSSSLKPAYKQIEYRQNGKAVNVKIFAGIGESKPSEAGWYIFCNGRLVLGANQADVTGWGEGEEVTIPKYHNQFATFRGYVFFDSDDAGLLPWNTTKTGVDSDSLIYKAIKQQMITIMRPIIDFLNKVKEEKEADEIKDPGPLESTINSAQYVKVADLNTKNLPKTFKSPQPISIKPKPKQGHIAYNKPLSEITKVKKVLKVTSLKEVGERTFEFFYDSEVDNRHEL